MIKKLSLLFLFLSCSVQAQENVLEQKIEKILTLSGASERFNLIMDKLIAIEEDNYQNDIEKEYFEAVKTEIKSMGFSDLVSMITPIYIKHLTEAEIDAIIDFYESEAGKTMRTKMPLILQESMEVGEEWGQKIGQDIITKMKNSELALAGIELEDCEKFKEGEFTYTLLDGREATVIREGNLQTETYKPKGKFKARIEWLTNCSYNLWELDENDQELAIEPLEVIIYEINGNSYKYISTKESVHHNYKGEITKVID